jgi:hypothetical protein
MRIIASAAKLFAAGTAETSGSILKNRPTA